MSVRVQDCAGQIPHQNRQLRKCDTAQLPAASCRKLFLCQLYFIGKDRQELVPVLVFADQNAVFAGLCLLERKKEDTALKQREHSCFLLLENFVPLLIIHLPSGFLQEIAQRIGKLRIHRRPLRLLVARCGEVHIDADFLSAEPAAVFSVVEHAHIHAQEIQVGKNCRVVVFTGLTRQHAHLQVAHDFPEAVRRVHCIILVQINADTAVVQERIARPAVKQHIDLFRIPHPGENLVVKDPVVLAEILQFSLFVVELHRQHQEQDFLCGQLFHN